jgi:hypothetical protein
MNNYFPHTVVPILPVLIIAGIIIVLIIWFLVIQPMISDRQQRLRPPIGTSKRVFISYRRIDSADVTGRLFDRLKERFGNAVFKDVDSIPVGVDFRTHIENALDSTGVFLAVIGPAWMEQLDRENPNRDFVYLETRIALEKGLPIIPVLVRGAGMPEPTSLPESLRNLAFINATKLRPDPDFNTDIQRLMDSVDAHLNMKANNSVDPTP